MGSIPFPYRVIALVAFAAVVVTVDSRRHGRRATRWREYAFLLACALGAAALGAGIDQVTSTVSPEYFAAKGIGEGPGFRGRVAAHGAQAGTSAGVIVGALLLLVLSRPNPGIPPRKWGWIALFPAAGAVLFGGLALLASQWNPPEHDPLGIARHLDAEARTRFLSVWWTHVAIYCGAAIGLAAVLWGLRSARRPAK